MQTFTIVIRVSRCQEAAYAKIWSDTGGLQDTNMPKHVIAIANQKGGVGKTTTTINTAYNLARARRSVLLVDLDPQANATSGLGFDKHALEHDIYHALEQPDRAPRMLHATPYGVSLLPASPQLATAEVEMVSWPQRELRLRQVLEVLEFDYILIDCPPSLGLLTVNGLSAATHALIPVQAEYYALEGLGQLLHTIELVKQGLNPDLSLLGVILTMYEGRTTLSKQVHEEVKRHFPETVFDEFVPRNVRAAEAPSYGQPLGTYDKRSKGAKAYKHITKEVMRRVES